MSVLPNNWKTSTIGEACEIVKGKKPKNSGERSEQRTIPYINIKAFESGLAEQFAEQGGYPACTENDVLIVWDGARSGLIGRGVSGYIGSTLARISCASLRDSFLFYLLQSKYGDINSRTKGVGIPHVDPQVIKTIKIPLPPFPDQRRIVAEIEKQFSRLEEGVSALQRVQANLKRYRAAVLKAACEGKLVETEAERYRKRKTKTSRLGFESGDQLLKRILDERRKKWQGRGKYKEPTAPDSSKLPTLPTSWSWVSWEMVLANEESAFKRGPFGSALTKAIFVDKGFKVYEQYCPINDDCSFARYYITPEKFEELKAFEVKVGDYLISCSGVTLGRITRVPEKCERGIINQALLRVRLNESVIDNKYFLHLFRSALFQKALFDNSTGSAIPNVKGVKELKAMAIPLPPLAEQKRIVEEDDRRLSVVE
jgi:type I restriction enzyme S subunit